MSEGNPNDTESISLTVQVLSWVYEHSIKYGMDDISSEIETKFEDAGMRPEFFRGFPLLVRRLQLLPCAELTPENVESLVRLLEDMLKITSLQQRRRLYGTLIKLYVVARLLSLHRQKFRYEDIQNRFPPFNWEQIKTDFCLYDDFFKVKFKASINYGHDVIRREFSWSRTALILNDKLLAELKAIVQTRVPKLVLLLHRVFPNTALDKLARDQDHCRHLAIHGVGAHSILVKSLRLVDGTAKFTRESVEEVVRSLTLKSPPPVITIDDSNSTKKNLSESSYTPEFICAKSKRGGPASRPSSPRVTRSHSRSCNESSLGSKRSRKSVGDSFSGTTIEELRLPRVLIKRNFVYIDGVEWPDEKGELRSSVKCESKNAKVKKARYVGSRKKTLRLRKNKRRQCKSGKASTKSRGCGGARKGEEDSPRHLKLRSSVETSVEDSFSTSDGSVSQQVPDGDRYDTRNVVPPDYLVVNGIEWPIQKWAPFHPLKMQGVNSKDRDTSEDAESVINLDVLKKNVRNFDKENFLQIPGASCKSIKIRVNSRERVIDDVNYHPLNFSRYTGDCASKYATADSLPEGVVGEKELRCLISRVESVLEVLKQKLKRMSSAEPVCERQESANTLNGSKANFTRSSEDSSEVQEDAGSHSGLQGSTTEVSENSHQGSENSEQNCTLVKSALEPSSVYESLFIEKPIGTVSEQTQKNTDQGTAGLADVGEPKVPSENVEQAHDPHSENEMTFLTAKDSISSSFMTAYS